MADTDARSVRDAIADQILWEMPDIIGLQEVESHQLSDMNDLLRANYDFVGVGRDDGQRKGEVGMSPLNGSQSTRGIS